MTSLVSLIDMMLLDGLKPWCALSLSGIRSLFLWQIATSQVLHVGPGHLIFNMLWLYFLGLMIESMIGKRRFVVLYAISGAAGGVLFLVMNYFGVIYGGEGAMLVGASAGIFGVMAAAVCVAPYLAIRFWFPPVSIPLWIVFVISVVVALLTIRIGGWNAGGEAAHLGGAAVGMALYKFRGTLDRLSRGGKRSRFWKPGDPASNFFRKA